MRRRSTAAISGPAFTPSVPTGSSFQRCTPSTTSTPSSAPSRDHGLRAALALLGGLEQHAHASRAGRAPARTRAADRAHGHVAVVAAGVHRAGHLRGVGRVGLLLDGQRVHVHAQQHGAAAASARWLAMTPVPADARAHVEARCLQERGHARRRARLRVGQLGMLVQVAPQGDQLGAQRAHVGGQLGHAGL